MRTALYRHWDKDGTLLYVGISLSALARLGQHAEHAHWFKSIASVTIEHFETRADALAAERTAIRSEEPLHNLIRYKEAEAFGEATRAEDLASQSDLVRRVVAYHPLYTLEEATDALSLRSGVLKQLIEHNRIGTVQLPNSRGKMLTYITGWQVIEFLEAVTADPNAAVIPIAEVRDWRKQSESFEQIGGTVERSLGREGLVYTARVGNLSVTDTSRTGAIEAVIAQMEAA